MFNSDKPISTTREDRLDRSIFAQQIAKSILLYGKQECLTIGIYGDWGEGKSSLANMILNEVDQNISNTPSEYICIIRFNPWLYSNKEDLISCMFKEISKAFNISDVEDTVQKTASVIEGIGKAANVAKYIPIPGFKEIASLISDLFNDYSTALKDNLQEKSQAESLTDLKSKIEEKLLSSRVKLVIAIDDFDRLNQNEIRLMFQVIKMLGDFKNTVYMLMMDRNVVVKSLEQVQGGDGTDYLKKIVQIPIIIHPASKMQLTDVLKSEFKKVIGQNSYNTYEELLGDMMSSCILPYIKNIRDIKRLINLFEFKYSFFKEEINSVDLFVQCCIETYDSSAHESIISAKDKMIANNWRETIQIPDERRSLKPSIEEIEIARTKRTEKCLKKLFDRSIAKCGKGDFRRFSNPRYYDSYLTLSLPPDVLNTDLIESVIGSYTKDELTNTFTNQQYKAVELITEISVRCDQIRYNRLKTIISVILNHYDYLINQRSVSKSTVIPLLSKLLNSLNFEDLKSIYSNSHFSNQGTKEAVPLINYLVAQEHNNNKMLNINCYDCDKAINFEQLQALEEICTENMRGLKIFEFNSIDFAMIYAAWRTLDKNECISVIKRDFSSSNLSEVKILTCLITMNYEEYSINITEANELIGVRELYQKIDMKTNIYNLSDAEKKRVKVFKYYYNHQSDYETNNNGFVIIPFYALLGDHSSNE